VESMSGNIRHDSVLLCDCVVSWGKGSNLSAVGEVARVAVLS
jgi:hypothetical protein